MSCMRDMTPTSLAAAVLHFVFKLRQSSEIVLHYKVRIYTDEKTDFSERGLALKGLRILSAKKD